MRSDGARRNSSRARATRALMRRLPARSRSLISSGWRYRLTGRRVSSSVLMRGVRAHSAHTVNRLLLRRHLPVVAHPVTFERFDCERVRPSQSRERMTSERVTVSPGLSFRRSSASLSRASRREEGARTGTTESNTVDIRAAYHARTPTVNPRHANRQGSLDSSTIFATPRFSRCKAEKA